MDVNKPWVYIRSETNVWTVGFYDPAGNWQPESDWGNPQYAASRCAWLNGSKVDPAEWGEEIGPEDYK